jgi:predicted DNA-binding transcriptional regulator AlpA
METAVMPDTTESPRLIDAGAVAQMLSLSVRQVFRLRDAGKLPKPVKLSRRCVRWNRATILDWIARQGTK